MKAGILHLKFRIILPSDTYSSTLISWQKRATIRPPICSSAFFFPARSSKRSVSVTIRKSSGRCFPRFWRRGFYCSLRQFGQCLFHREVLPNFIAAFSNASLMGIPLILTSLGAQAVFCSTSFTIMLNILQWTYGQRLLSR